MCITCCWTIVSCINSIKLSFTVVCIYFNIKGNSELHSVIKSVKKKEELQPF